jgi:hypothetical protein
VLAITAAACAPGGPSTPPSVGPTAMPSPAAAATATTGPSRTPLLTSAPVPSGMRLLPNDFAIEIEPGTYWSAPPFDLGFSFEVAEDRWVAGHLNPEFVDLQRYEGAPGEGIMPERIVGFAHPKVIHDTVEVVDAAELTPEAIAELWVARTDIEATNVTEVDLLGGDAVRVDVHAPIPMLPLFGGDDGTFRLDSAFDVRLVVVAIDGGIFMATVHAPAADLEAAWAQALPILESIDLP